MIDDKIVCNACEPWEEASGLGVSSLAKGQNDLDKRFLKKVVGQVCIANSEEDVIVQPIFMTLQEAIESLIASFLITLNQILVGHLIELFHYNFDLMNVARKVFSIGKMGFEKK